ncbi:MAG: Hsp20/alpha crystallin family protein [Anaerolineales bacterium]
MSMYVKPYTRFQRYPAYRLNSVESDIHVPLDVILDGDSYLIEMIVPGLDPEDLEIEIVENNVIVEGQFDEAEEDQKYLRKERPTGKFRRVVRLPKLLDTEKTEANLQKGILSLRVPVAEEALPKTIKVKAQ